MKSLVKVMNRVNWNGEPLSATSKSLPPDLTSCIFDYLPDPVEFTSEMSALAERYLNGQFNWPEYRPMQSAAFLKPESDSNHATRRTKFSQLIELAGNEGFSLPKTFTTLVQTDEYVDRIHHNTIWLELPEELWRLPSDPTKLMFLAFTEGQGCCAWHLLLSNDGTHQMACCEHPFGLVSIWPGGKVPDYTKWKVEICADSIEEWLYYYFKESAEFDQKYLKNLAPYHQKNGG